MDTSRFFLCKFTTFNAWRWSSPLTAILLMTPVNFNCRSFMIDRRISTFFYFSLIILILVLIPREKSHFNKYYNLKKF